MKHIYITNSGINGKGLFAGEEIKRGETIRLIKGEMKFKVNNGLEDALANPNWIGVSQDQWIDPDKFFKFINHSCHPSAGVKGKVTCVALHDIKEGDEITFDYSTIEADDLWQMACSCTAENCRRIIKSIKHLPEENFQQYFPYVSNYFKKLYLKSKNGADVKEVKKHKAQNKDIPGLA